MSTQTLRPPKLTPIRLPDLTPAEPNELVPHGTAELIKLDSRDLSGRDLTGIEIADALFVNVTAHQTRLRSARIVDTIIDRMDAPVLTAPGISFRDVEITESRITSAEFYDASWRSVHFTGCKLGYLNLRSAEIHDLLFTDCTIDELDIAGAKLHRVAFENTRITTLEAHHATHTDTDLRGASISRINGIEGLRGAAMNQSQVADLAATLAAMIGIRTTD